jgi:hypothetical protein
MLSGVNGQVQFVKMSYANGSGKTLDGSGILPSGFGSSVAVMVAKATGRRVVPFVPQ